MTKQKSHLELRKSGDSYSLTEVRPTYNVYRGKIFALKNKKQQYAFMFREEIPALSGPAGHEYHILDVGEYPVMGRDDFIDTFLEDSARAGAKTLADKLKLPLKVIKD